MNLKNIFLTLIVLCGVLSNSFAQKERAIHVGVSGALVNKFGEQQLFLASDLQLGFQSQLGSGELKVFGAYQLFGNMPDGYYSSYTFASQLIGVGAEYQAKSDKLVSLIVGTAVMTEIYSNFKNGYMTEGSLVSPRSEKPYGSGSGYPPTEFQKTYNYYESDHYQSTPLHVSIWLGVNVKLTKALNANFSVINDVRLITEKYLKWDLTDKEEDQVNLIGKDINDLIDSQPTSRTIVDRFGLRVGLSYTIPIAKKK